MGIHTYFVAAQNHVKIGRSANPKGRVRGLQTGQSVALKVLLVLDGDREREMHELFARHRTLGEWFVLSDEIKNFINDHLGKPKSFKRWLLEQRHRVTRDAIGAVAFKIAKEPRLRRVGYNELLKHYEGSPRIRSAIKHAHAEWFKTRASV